MRGAGEVSLLDRLDEREALELACKADLGVWAQMKRGLRNSALHWEWCSLVQTPRLCVVAPREHAKSETFTVNQAAWRCTYEPGIWVYVFAETGDQAAALKARIDTAIEETAPWLLDPPIKQNTTMTQFANYSMVTVAGAGKGVRGAHPDLIIGDDVLSEGSCMTNLQRQRVERWWFGTIGGMSHPGTERFVGSGKVAMPPTRVHLVGTPFHQADLLMNMRTNPLYRFRRYAAEYRPDELVEGTLAVEVT